MVGGDRNGLVDALRGWSLFGILIANLLIFQYGIFGKDEISFFGLSSLDYSGYVAIKIFIENSFMPIFTFLFGYSLILMRNRLKEKKRRVKWHFFRRFLILILFGVLHSIYLWEGDILLLYGVMGMLLLFFVNRKRKTILVWCVVLFLFVTLISFLGGEEKELISEEKIDVYLKDTMKIYGSGSYEMIKHHRNNVDPMEMSEGEAFFVVLFMPFLILPMMLLGMYAAHVGWLYPNKVKFFQYISIICLPLGLFLKATLYLSKEIHWLPDMGLIGGSVLAIGYIGMFSYFYSKLNGHLFQGFENLGKLSLTNYMLQTVVCTSVFYGYGFGLFRKMGVILSILFGIGLFTLQVVGSTFFLKRFRQGPLEKVMRTFVYLENPFQSRKKRQLKDEMKVS
ncbi:DUF418 domain-containing protein [Pseudalkalibacillus hwajinpoensis]|uniref:DUF418 domain-containing protein n=1 Tax=Guptibacillus hwajinpoensis TaxID=208199 RepID=UPI001CD62398|nr:DUF418 domain-containing protein [Pseudalkalibacillus hwajinpoensis]MCA0989684.1 DUF418 domain-containing protein [Pseudalkalibacillus hwajinpoensis]